jgi:general secretion pathway protein K
MTTLASRTRSRGVAFVLVLWVIATLSILLGSFAMITRTENLQARHLFDTTRARYAAEAGLNLAVYELRKNDQLQRWIPDGRPYAFQFDDAQVEVRLTDDSGKIDINTAKDEILASLFMRSGVEEEQAVALAAAVEDWRDPDDLETPNGAEVDSYHAAGLSYEPANEPFNTVSELQQVIGMSYALYEKIEPAVTIYSGRGDPNLSYAPLEALESIPGITPEIAQQLIAQRQALPPGYRPGIDGPPLTLPDGTPIPMASGGGLTYSVESRATLPSGAHTVLEATIRLGGVNAAGRPYTILRWRDGETS